MRRLTLVAVPGLPMIEPGDDLAALTLEAMAASGESLADGDVLAVAQKIVSKAEGRYVDLRQVQPSQRARELAAEVEKDPRLVEVVLSESTEIVATRPGVLVVAHRLGIVLANAGIDQSNIAHPKGDDRVLLLPSNPDASAGRLRESLRQRCAIDVGVVITDSVGRAWRIGTVGLALGAAGVPAVQDLRGQQDLFGRRLQVTEVGLGDEIAAASSLLMGQANEASPVVLVRGLDLEACDRPAAALIRPKEEDLFR